MSQVTLGGNPIEVAGTFPAVGQKAPAFSLVGKDLKPVTLADFAGKRKVLNIVPSLDTPTCATSTRKFNEAAGKLSNTAVIVVSGDLPFAATRFCTTEGIENVLDRFDFPRPRVRASLRRRRDERPADRPDGARRGRHRRKRQRGSR